jgi:hypothetical protein
VDGAHVLAATHSRLLLLSLPGLEVLQSWERGLVRYSRRIEVDGEHIVMAGWLSPSIGVLHTATGRVRRLRCGVQPMLFQYRGSVRVISGLDGGMHTLDVARARLVEPVPVPPISSIAVGEDVWGVVAGDLETPRVAGVVPQDAVLPRFRRGSGQIMRLTGEPMSVLIEGRCVQLWCDDARGLLWCFTEKPGSPGVVTGVHAIDQSGQVVTEFHTETPTTLRQLDPELGIVPQRSRASGSSLAASVRATGSPRQLPDITRLSVTNPLSPTAAWVCVVRS